MTIYDLTVTATDSATGQSGTLTVQFPVNNPTGDVESTGVFRLALGGKRMGGQATVQSQADEP